MIKAEKISYSFPQKDLYNKISFTLEDDVHCAFIGTNGTGKSTLVDMILHPDNYLYDGRLIVDVPGFKKEEVKVALKDGYLTVSAAKGLDEDEEDKKGHYIRRERYAGACERSFYVGEEVTQEDIKGEYKHGILKLFVPKKEAKPVSNDPKYITIE